MARFAEGTTIHAASTKSDVERAVAKFGGELTSFGWTPDGMTELVMFRWRGVFYRFAVDHPPKPDERGNPPDAKTLADIRDRELATRFRNPNNRMTWSQLRQKEIDRRWRVLLKLHLEPLFKIAIESEDSRVSDAVLMPFAMLPDNTTIAEEMTIRVREVYGDVPALPAFSGNVDK